MTDEKNMFDSYSKAAKTRKQEQEKVESTAKGQGVIRKRGEGATTMTLAISKEDKLKVKAYAATHATTVSDLLHMWITEYCND